MGKPCISSGFMQTCPHPLEQHFSEPEPSSSPRQTSTQMPIWSGLGLGQNSGFPSAAGNFNIIFMLIFCYSVLAERFSSSSLSSSSLLLSLSLSIFFQWNTNYAGSYYWCHFKQEQTCQFCTVVTAIKHNKERLRVNRQEDWACV